MASKTGRLDFTKRNKWITILIVFVLLYFSAVFYRQQQSLDRLAIQAAELEAELQRLERASKLMQQQVEHLESDMFYIENFARRELGLVREGERVYIVPRRNND